ncbi:MULTISPECIES: trans-aconitate 2-methyltransferase [Chryseobacterium]|uniref:Trans-aconitate 2-methyltransferase n=1 Tax=Chryseobacterium salivictor TaxID=2547600 RepID=A0A4P6ZGT0_9FLAO|nr:MULTISPECIES: class I SAM-dependent methyltransferase [Chryseobacterium]MDQ0477622.1 SAM-dependent methyltransferase [Chryseobacterium sp. MDT2-18]QBO58809.1 Trans-aconitate 2-methyltransferase [Chryseobacterium salivictor]
MNTERKEHWEKVYETKNPHEVSWTQEVPETSLALIHSFGLDRSAKMIDIGGGDSKLVDFLLDEGFENLTVLDISAKALEKAKKRLGEKAGKVTWIVSDITEFKPETTYDVWHDRATFHFLTEETQVKKYVDIAEQAVSGYLVIGTFSENGPEKCSGLPVRQYTTETLVSVFAEGFEKLSCRTENHETPFGTEQNFVFCSFKRSGG